MHPPKSFLSHLSCLWAKSFIKFIGTLFLSLFYFPTFPAYRYRLYNTLFERLSPFFYYLRSRNIISLDRSINLGLYVFIIFCWAGNKINNLNTSSTLEIGIFFFIVRNVGLHAKWVGGIFLNGFIAPVSGCN